MGQEGRIPIDYSKLQGNGFRGKRYAVRLYIRRQVLARKSARSQSKSQSDLIIMGSRGHTRLSLLTIASTVQRVFLTAHCPCSWFARWSKWRLWTGRVAPPGQHVS